MRAQVHTHGVEQATRMLAGSAARAANPRAAWRQVADDYLREMSAEFASSGGRGGAQWAPLSSETLDRKAADGLPARILEASGALKASLATRGPGHVEEVTRSSLSLGTSVPYARYPQHGTRSMPARPVQPSAAAQSRWVELLAHEIVEGHQ